jgi:[ribosomal protein S18]-alanine N-acetyltransferase
LPSLSFNIEPLSAKDIAAACQLELAAGLRTSGEATMLARLSNPQMLILVAVPSVVASSPPPLLGLFSGWVVLDELEVDNLVVANSTRRQGIGKALLTAGLQQAWLRGAKYTFLEVRESNIAALSLYNTLGFSLIGRRHCYYHDPSEDALVLRLDLVQVASELSLRHRSKITSIGHELTSHFH